MARKQPPEHPGDIALDAMVDDELPDGLVSSHVAACEHCQARVRQLRAMRRLLAASGTQQFRAHDDITQRATGRLRMRETAIGGINEVFAAVRSLLRGLAELFGGSTRDGSAALPPDEVSHG